MDLHSREGCRIKGREIGVERREEMIEETPIFFMVINWLVLCLVIGTKMSQKS